MENMVKLFSKAEIQKAVDELSLQISKYIDEHLKNLNEIHFITILKEGIHFSTDLSLRLQKYPLIFDYIFLENVNPENRELAIEKDIFLSVKNRVIFVCSVLTRTGYELNFIENYLKIRGALQVKTISLISKENSSKKPDFYYFTVPQDYFLVGYGLDYQEKYRNLNEIFKINIDNK